LKEKYDAGGHQQREFARDTGERIKPENAQDVEYIFIYHLDIGTTNDITGMMGNQRVARDLDYFLECEAAE
jgi:hypothetical protein